MPNKQSHDMLVPAVAKKENAKLLRAQAEVQKNEADELQTAVNSKKRLDYLRSMPAGASGLSRTLEPNSLDTEGAVFEKLESNTTSPFSSKTLTMQTFINVANAPTSDALVALLKDAGLISETYTPQWPEVIRSNSDTAGFAVTMLGKIGSKPRPLRFQAEKCFKLEIGVDSTTFKILLAYNRYEKTAFIRFQANANRIEERLLIFNGANRLTMKTTNWDSDSTKALAEWNTLVSTNRLLQDANVNQIKKNCNESFPTTPAIVLPDAESSGHPVLFELNKRFPYVRYLDLKNTNDLPHLARCLEDTAQLEFIAATLRAVVAAFITPKDPRTMDAAIRAGMHNTQARFEIAQLADLVSKLSSNAELGANLVNTLASQRWKDLKVNATFIDAARDGWKVQGQCVCRNVRITTEINRHVDLQKLIGTDFKISTQYDYHKIFTTRGELSSQTVYVNAKRTQNIRLTLDKFHQKIEGVASGKRKIRVVDAPAQTVSVSQDP